MSFVIAVPEYVAAAASDLANIGSAISSANMAALVPTGSVLAAGADGVSAQIAALFSAHAQIYQALSEQAALFHQQFVQLMNTAGGLYANTEAANAVLSGVPAASAAAAAPTGGAPSAAAAASPSLPSLAFPSLQGIEQGAMSAINVPTGALLSSPLMGSGVSQNASAILDGAVGQGTGGLDYSSSDLGVDGSGVAGANTGGVSALNAGIGAPFGSSSHDRSTGGGVSPAAIFHAAEHTGTGHDESAAVGNSAHMELGEPGTGDSALDVILHGNGGPAGVATQPLSAGDGDFSAAAGTLYGSGGFYPNATGGGGSLYGTRAPGSAT